MNKHFEQITESEWLTKPDRDDFARFCYIYAKNIEPEFGHFDWNSDDFVQYCKQNKIQRKGTSHARKTENHIWFNATKPASVNCNDFAHHFMRHIRNAFAHGLIEISRVGRRHSKFFILKDFDKNGDQTMGGYIRSDLLWGMLWLLYQTRK